MSKIALSCFLATIAALVAISSLRRRVMFSRVAGSVVIRGQVVPDIEVRRHYRWAWNGATSDEATRTDARGEFAFDLATRRAGLLTWWVPHEPLVHQSIEIQHDGKTYVGWQHTKHDYDDNSEANGRPMYLSCDLGREARPQGSDRNDSFGVCVLR